MGLALGLAILALLLIPLVPGLLRFRIRFFRWVHWDWAADVHERHFSGLVSGARVALFVVAIILLYLAL